MKVLITGGTGSLAEYLIKEMEGSHDLVLFDRIMPGEGRFAYVTGHQFVVGDLTSAEDCARAVAGCDAVIHLGAIRYPTDHPAIVARVRATGEVVPPFDETMRVNTMGTYHVMHAAVQAGVKAVVAITSNCILGHAMRLNDKPFPIRYLPIDEEHPTDVQDSYSLSKSFQEQIMQAYTRAYGIRSYALRPSVIFRPERQEEHARTLKPTEEWSVALLNGYTDIADVARALRMCLEAHRDLPEYDAYYLNGPDSIALEDSADLVRRLRPDLVPVLRDLPGRAPFISAGKAKRAFGWEPNKSWTRFLVAASV